MNVTSAPFGDWKQELERLRVSSSRQKNQTELEKELAQMDIRISGRVRQLDIALAQRKKEEAERHFRSFIDEFQKMTALELQLLPSEIKDPTLRAEEAKNIIQRYKKILVQMATTIDASP